jgi:uncharacterized membrane protein YeaQ/YmgE (transglycosylase-associated protein family)
LTLRTSVIGVLVLLLAGDGEVGAAHAAPWPESVLTIGQRVRVSTTMPASPDSVADSRLLGGGPGLSKPVIGTVSKLGATGLEILPDGEAFPLKLANSSIVWLEVSAGRKSRAGRGALIGLITGGVAGVIASEAFVEVAESEEGVQTFSDGVLGLGGALVGAGLEVAPGPHGDLRLGVTVPLGAPR